MGARRGRLIGKEGNGIFKEGKKKEEPDSANIGR